MTSDFDAEMRSLNNRLRYGARQDQNSAEIKARLSAIAASLDEVTGFNGPDEVKSVNP